MALRACSTPGCWEGLSLVRSWARPAIIACSPLPLTLVLNSIGLCFHGFTSLFGCCFIVFCRECGVQLVKGLLPAGGSGR